MHTTAELIEIFQKGTAHLTKMAEQMDFPWFENEGDPRKLHNMYARNLITCYVSKFAQLSDSLIESVERRRFLVYALAGRSLIELSATLRYYMVHRYKPLLDKAQLSSEEFQQLIEIDDQHLRGGRFDWHSFFLKRYTELKEDAVKQLASKRAKQKHIAAGIISEQVNVLTCIEKWADETPEILIAYNLFCDLVHPNIGSSFMVASTYKEQLYFKPTAGLSVGADIFEQSFPLLISVTQKVFGGHLAMLISTIWHDDEI